MGADAGLRAWLPPLAVWRLAVGLGLLSGGAAILLSTWLSALPEQQALQRTRGQVETVEAGRRALHFTLAGRQEHLHYPRRGGEVETVLALLERARTSQVLLLLDPATGAVYEVEGQSGARRYEQVAAAWDDRRSTDVGLGLAFLFVGAGLVGGRPR